MLSLDETVVAVSRLLVFDRAGPDIRTAISKVVEESTTAAS
jgi:hypothetical protein